MIRVFFREFFSAVTGNDNGTFAATRIGKSFIYFTLLLCGMLFTCAFPGIGVSHLVWIGLVPLYHLTSDRPVKSAFLRGWVWGFGFYFTVFFWLREIALPLPLLPGLFFGLLSAAWAAVTAWMKANLAWPVETRLKGELSREKAGAFNGLFRSLSFLFASAAFWCILEWLRSWIFTGLPWNNLAESQWRNLILIQICEYTGVYGVSFVIVLFNVAIGMSIPVWAAAIREHRYRRSLPLLAACVVLALTIGSGWHLFAVQMRKNRLQKHSIHKFGVVQCALIPNRSGGEKNAAEALDVCLGLTEKLLRSKDKPELIIWPETAVPHPFRGSSRTSARYRREISHLIMRNQIPYLLGTIDFEIISQEPFEYKVYNSALLIKTADTATADSYNKVHRVPFGEYVPWGDEFPFLCSMIGMGRNLTPGKRCNPIEIIPGVRAGISICFEAVFPEISRAHIFNGANLLLVISDNAWYPTSNEPDQFFANMLFRAVETRLPVLHSGNMDYSAVIDPVGKVTDSVSKMQLANGCFLLSPEKKMRGAEILQVAVPEEYTPTFYVRHGNIFIYLCFLLAGIGLISSFAAWRDFRGAQNDPERCKEILPGAIRKK